ncbi:MAG: tRNA (adenosine(37)-N6)-threonylcarbamoyltransferase complex ATPase subunit type 1 TsaE [Acidobacteriota bacterium]
MTTTTDAGTAETYICTTPDQTFEIGRSIGSRLRHGDAILLTGGLGGGKTLLTKGIVDALGFDIDEVTSPSFTLVNLYKTDKADVYHIDLWRIDQSADPIFAVGLDELTQQEDTIVIIEWAEQLGAYKFPATVYRATIKGDGDDARTVTVEIETPVRAI